MIGQELTVKVDGGDLTVTGQGTDYTLTYKKWPDVPADSQAHADFDALPTSVIRGKADMARTRQYVRF